MTARTMFPTLADAPRAEWPATLRIHPAPLGIGGSEETIECGCQRTVPAREMVDLREIPAGERADLGILTAVLCQACFHTHESAGRHLHYQIAERLGLHAAVVASLRAGATEAVARGWASRTARNQHLAR